MKGISQAEQLMYHGKSLARDGDVSPRGRQLTVVNIGRFSSMVNHEFLVRSFLSLLTRA
jgi:hypothetical protein